MGIDLLDAAQRKLNSDGLRYPADEIRGSAQKRT
jgi:hypothetical protein